MLGGSARGQYFEGDEHDNHTKQHGMIYSAIHQKIMMAAEGVIFRWLCSRESLGTSQSDLRSRIGESGQNVFQDPLLKCFITTDRDPAIRVGTDSWRVVVRINCIVVP